jgi:hypothetical protein
MNETIKWRRPKDELPDDDQTVLLCVERAGERECYAGFLDAEQWHDSTGMPVDAAIIAWAPMPEGPA